MDLLTWLIVGLVAGVLASMVMGGTGYGLIGDIIIGILGAFVGGWVFRKLGAGVPFGGLAGVICVKGENRLLPASWPNCGQSPEGGAAGAWAAPAWPVARPWAVKTRPASSAARKERRRWRARR